MGHKRSLCRCIYTLKRTVILLCKCLKETHGQRDYILPTFSERRKFYVNCVYPVVKVLTETAFTNQTA